MFAGIDIASERHLLARFDDAGVPLGKPVPITEDRECYAKLIEWLGPLPVRVVMEATGHYWKNLFAVLPAAGHEVALLNPFQARRFQEASLERTKTDAVEPRGSPDIDAQGLARFAYEKRPAPTRLHDEAAESLCELVRHRDRLRQDFDDRVRQLHRLVDLGVPERKPLRGFAEFTRYVRSLAETRSVCSLDSQLATCLLAEYPTAHAVARATRRRLAKLRYDGWHFVGPELAGQLAEAAKRSIGQHHGPAYKLQARYICQDLDLWPRRLAEIERDIEDLLDTRAVGRLLTTIDGIGPQSAARIVEPRGSPDIAAVGDPARFKTAAAFAVYVGVVPRLKYSGKRTGTRASIAPLGNARLRMALWMLVLGAVRRNPWLRAFYERLRASGKPSKLALVALVAAMRKFLHAVYSVAKHRRPFTIKTAAA